MKMYRFWHVYIIILKNQVIRQYSATILPCYLSVWKFTEKCFQRFLLNVFHKLHVEKSDFPETPSIPHHASYYPGAWWSSDLQCLPHRSLVSWADARGSVSSLCSWGNWGSEMGLIKQGCKEYRCLFSCNQRKLDVKFSSDLCIFADHTKEPHLPHRSLATSNLGRGGSGGQTTAETPPSWLLPNGALGIQLGKKINKRERGTNRMKCIS